MKSSFLALGVVALPAALTDAFVVVKTNPPATPRCVYMSDNNNNNYYYENNEEQYYDEENEQQDYDQQYYEKQQQQPPSSLVLSGEEMTQHMQQLRSKYPTSEADYLAAARERARHKASSQKIQATVQDFQKVADEKKQAFGELDDWEQSAKEAGNMDSQILLPQLPDDEDDGDGGEPTLLL